jgi:hypothetical protein
MKAEKSDAEQLLDQLCARLKVSTSEWTSAATDKLRAVAAPHRRDNGRWDIVVHIQKAVPRIPKDLFRCVVQVKGHPDIRASLTPSGRLVLGPLDAGEATLVLYDVSAKLAESLQQATLSWQAAAAASTTIRAQRELPVDHATLELAADGRFSPRVWEWASEDRLLSAHATREQYGLKFYFESTEPALQGRQIEIRVGNADPVSLILGKRSDRDSVFGSHELRTETEGSIRFALAGE